MNRQQTRSKWSSSNCKMNGLGTSQSKGVLAVCTTDSPNKNNNASNSKGDPHLCIRRTYPKFKSTNWNYYFGYEHDPEAEINDAKGDENDAEGDENLEWEETNDEEPDDDSSTHSDPLLYYPENYVNPIYYEERDNPPADQGIGSSAAHFSGRRTADHDINLWANGLTKERRRVLICKLCKNFLAKARMLPCLHMFCSPCLKVFYGSKLPQQTCTCPICDQTFPYPSHGVEGMKKALWVKRMFEANFDLLAYEQAVCEFRGNDDDHSKADMYCQSCERKFCNECFSEHVAEGHGRNELHKGCTLLEYEKKVISDKWKYEHDTVKCKPHLQQVDQICRFCKKVMCFVCAAEHPKHVQGAWNTESLERVVLYFRRKLDSTQSDYLKSERELDKRFNDVQEYERRLNTDSAKLNEVIGQRSKKAHEFVDKLAIRTIDKYNRIVISSLKAMYWDMIDSMLDYVKLKRYEIQYRTALSLINPKDLILNCQFDDSYKEVPKAVAKCFLSKYQPPKPKKEFEIKPVILERVVTRPGAPYINPTASLGVFVTKAKLCRKFKVMPLPIECIAIGKNGDMIVTIHRTMKPIGKTLMQVTSTFIHDKDFYLRQMGYNIKHPFDVCFGHAYLSGYDDDRPECLFIVDRLQQYRHYHLTGKTPWEDEQEPTKVRSFAKAKCFIYEVKNNKREIRSGEFYNNTNKAFNPIVLRPFRNRVGYVACNTPKRFWSTSTVTCYDRYFNEIVIYNQPRAQTLLKWPEYMHINSKDTIIILDTITYKLYFMDINGIISHSYAKKSDALEDRPTNFCIDSSDFIYICYRDGHRVDRLWPDGAFESTVVRQEDRLNGPTALAVHGNILVVGDVEGHLNYFRVEKKKLSPNLRQMYGGHQTPGVNTRLQ